MNTEDSPSNPLERLVGRLRELAAAVTQGRESVAREFTMRVPAEPERDADLVLSTAADMLDRLSLSEGTIEFAQAASRLLYGFMLDVNAIGVQGAGENLVRGIKHRGINTADQPPNAAFSGPGETGSFWRGLFPGSAVTDS